MPKAQPVPLSTFHGSFDAEQDDDKLPSAHGGSGLSEAATKKWVAEWGGHSGGLPQAAEGTGGGGTAAAAKGATIETYKASIDLCLHEFLNGGDLAEAALCVTDLAAPQFNYQVVKRAVTLAMDKTGRECEMAAVLIASLHARGVLTTNQVTEGLEALLEGIEDLTLDIPAAASLLSHFVADAYLDGVLPFSILGEWPGAYQDKPVAAEVLRQALERLDGRTPLGGSQVEQKQKVRAQLRPVVEEYLQSKDVGEVRRRMAELRVPEDTQCELVRVGIEIGLERKDHERELVSQLLSAAYANPIRPEEVSKGFEALLARVHDLAIDNPQAPSHLAAFMVRAVQDDILPPAFVTTSPPAAFTTRTQLDCLAMAKAPLTASHFGEKRRHVWGAGAEHSLGTLKRAVTLLAEEALVSGELGEAVRCVRELEAPSYHHEVVKRLVVLSLDAGARELALATQLTEKLCAEQLLTPEQLAMGCTRLVEAIDDLVLDNPKAPSLLADFLDAARENGRLLPADEWEQATSKLRGA